MSPRKIARTAVNPFWLLPGPELAPVAWADLPPKPAQAGALWSLEIAGDLKSRQIVLKSTAPLRALSQNKEYSHEQN